MNKTKIEWCDMTWNPITGCRHGCEYCYARRVAQRYGKAVPDTSDYPVEHDGCHVLESRIPDNPYPNIFEPTFLPFRLKEPAQKEKPQTIFVCSMSDLFGEWVPTEWILRVFEACKNATQHRYLFLTKNPARYAYLDCFGLLPKGRNFWYGATVTGIEDKGIFVLDPQHQTFLSMEPLLAPINYAAMENVDWLIIGAETGNRAGKVVPQREWVDDITKAAGPYTPVFMKDSMLPIMGEGSMRRELPWEV